MKKQYIKYGIRTLCLLISALLVLTGCQQNPVDPDTTTTTTTTTTTNGSGDAADTTDSTTGSTGTTGTTGTTGGTVADNNGSSVDDDFVAAVIPTVSVTKKTDKNDGDSGDNGAKPEITKPNSGAFTVKSKAINGKNKKLTGFKMLTKNPVAFQKVEFEMNVPTLPEGTNMYDDKEVDITIEMVSSTGKKLTADAFYYQEYEFLKSMQLKGVADTDPTFRLRVSPKEEGTWDFTVTLAVNGKTVDTLSAYINVAKSEVGSEILSVEPNRKQNFKKANGEVIAMIGQNVAWAVPNSQTTKAGQYIAREMNNMADYGCNYVRTWAGNTWGGMGVHTGEDSMSQSASAMWDYVIDTAEKRDMYVSFVLWTHGITSMRPELGGEGNFKSTPYYSEKGGYIDDAKDFFTDEKTYRMTEMYMRYVVSRWGYSEQVLCWELFNEADISDAGAANMIDEIRGFLSKAADYLRGIDTYSHMVASSTAAHGNPLTFYSIFDFMYPHRYNYTSIKGELNYIKSSWLQYQRPMLFGECGLNGSMGALAGGSIQDDFLSIHQQNWFGLMGGSAGTAMNWFWDGFNTKEGYWIYQVVSEMAELIPWEDPQMYMANTDSLSPSNDLIEGLGYRGKDYAYLWFYDRAYKPTSRIKTDFKNEKVQVRLNAGTYYVRWVDTRTGVSVKKEKLTLKYDGYLEMTMPDWSMDIAVTVTTD